MSPNLCQGPLCATGTCLQYLAKPSLSVFLRFNHCSGINPSQIFYKPFNYSSASPHFSLVFNFYVYRAFCSARGEHLGTSHIFSQSTHSCPVCTLPSICTLHSEFPQRCMPWLQKQRSYTDETEQIIFMFPYWSFSKDCVINNQGDSMWSRREWIVAELKDE